MRPISDPNFDPKTAVAVGYDGCAEAYAAARDSSAPAWLSLVTDRLEDRASVLDIGCGGGVPIARTLATRFDVTGIDISTRQVELARSNVPNSAFIHGDIMEERFDSESFDAVVMLFTLFHLPRSEHSALLCRIRDWLRGGGLLLATLATDSQAGYTEAFFGTEMYWSHFAAGDYRNLFEQAGLAVQESHRYDPSLHRYRLTKSMVEAPAASLSTSASVAGWSSGWMSSMNGRPRSSSSV